MVGGIHVQTHRHRESRLPTEELLEAVFSLQFNKRYIKRTALCSGPWLAVTACRNPRAEDLIIKLFPSNCRLHNAYLTALFQLSCIMSHIQYGIVGAVSSGSIIPAFRS
jgi:hypothetical protein